MPSSEIQAMEAQAEHPKLANDWFVGSVKTKQCPAYRLKNRGVGNISSPEKEAGNERLPPSPSTSRLTQEWLEEAKTMVAAASSRHTGQVRSSGPQRFAQDARAKELSSQPSLDRRGALSRSARRSRTTEGISDQILQRSSARHIRNRSDVHLTFAVSKNFSSPFDVLDGSPSPTLGLPPKLSPHPRPRFQEKATDVPPRRSFRTPLPTSGPPSPLPPENASHQPRPLSPPRVLIDSAHRRSISSSNSSIEKPSTPRMSVSDFRKPTEETVREEDVNQINSFLSRQRAMITRVSDGEVSAKAKIILSSYSPNTSSMVAAICYAWLLENSKEKEKSGTKNEVVVPVINMRRERMWEHKQAAWIFHHIGIDASALFFSDELDLEGLLMGKQLSLRVVGQDVLRTNGEVGSLCTILTDNYCEDAYNLLQASSLKRLLLAGILLDTHNLNTIAKTSTNRDAEAVQLLLVGSPPNFRDFFFQQVIKDHGEDCFLEALRQHYGKPPIEVKQMPSTVLTLGRAASHPIHGLPPTPHKAIEKYCRSKNKFSVVKLLGFGSK